MSVRRVLTVAGFGSLELTHDSLPRNPRSGNPVLICHSAGSLDDGFGKSLPALAQAVAIMGRGSDESGRLGIRAVGGSMGGTLPWGNTLTQTRLDSMYGYVGGTGKVNLLACSMGTAAALRWAAANPAKVGVVNIVLPMASLIHIYQQNAGSSAIASAGVGANTIATAWGLTYNVVTVSLTAGSPNATITAGTMLAGQNLYELISNTGGVRQTPNNPIPFASKAAFVDATHFTIRNAGNTANVNATVTGSFTIAIAQPMPSSADLAGSAVAGALQTAGIPVRLFYSTVDQYVDPADVTALAAAIGTTGEAHAIDSTFGHVNASIATWASYNAGTLFSDLIANLVANGA